MNYIQEMLTVAHTGSAEFWSVLSSKKSAQLLFEGQKWDVHFLQRRHASLQDQVSDIIWFSLQVLRTSFDSKEFFGSTPKKHCFM